MRWYFTIFNFAKYGYEYYKVDLTLNKVSRINELRSYAHINPNILYIDETIGGSDFEFDMEVKNKSDFLKIIYELKEKFPEIQRYMEQVHQRPAYQRALETGGPYQLMS